MIHKIGTIHPGMLASISVKYERCVRKISLSGDRLLWQGAYNQSWPTLRVVKFLLRYPQSSDSTGGLVSCMVVTVISSSGEG
jgi:hypothetical protein